MLFYNLLLLMLFTLQLVAALPLSVREQQLDRQPCSQSDPPLEGLLEGTIDQQPDDPPPGLSPDEPPHLSTDLPLQLRPSQPTTAQPPVATVTSIQLVNSPSGEVTETCIITLTPVDDKVIKVTNCTLSSTPPTVSSSVTAESSSISTASSTYVSIATSSSSSVQTSSSAVTTSSAPVSTYSSSVQTTPVDVPASSSSIPTSTSTVSTSSSVLTSASFVPTSVSSSAGVEGNSFKPGGTSSVSASAASNSATSTSSVAGTVAAAAAADATTDETVPGRKLSVLPIGLGVFAGISVIALVVVGLVTYERTKYRKAFRQRKLAESGATMGNGGIAF